MNNYTPRRKDRRAVPMVALLLIGLVLSSLAGFDQAADRVLSPIRGPGQLLSSRASTSPAPISLERRMRPTQVPQAPVALALFDLPALDASSERGSAEAAPLAVAVVAPISTPILTGPGSQRSDKAAAKSASSATSARKATVATNPSASGPGKGPSMNRDKEPKGPPSPKHP